MDAELIENADSHAPTDEPYEDFLTESSQQDQEIGLRTITWSFTCSGVKVDQEVYERLQSEIDWTESADDEGCMIFRSKDADAIDSFSKKLTKIISEGRKKSTTKSFTFTLTPEDR